MKKSFIIIGSIFFPFLFVLLSIQPAYSQNGAYLQNYFEDFEDGQAQGWDLESGWQVITDGSNKVMSGQGHKWARSNQNCADCILSFRVKVIEGGIHLVFRMNDEGRYFFSLDANGSRLNKQYWPDSFQNNLKNNGTKHANGTWHQVEIEGMGSKITFKVNGKTEWTFTDSKPLLNGSIAFETLDDSRVYVDDISVSSGRASVPAMPVQGRTPTAKPVLPLNTAVPTVKPSAGLTWVRTGGPMGGLGYDVRMSPDNPDRLYVTDAFAGIFISDNSGQSWVPSNQGISVRTGPSNDAIPIFSLTIDPNNADIIWAGTQFMRGIFKSMDGGHTWKMMNSGIVEKEGISFRGFTVEPGNSNVVYAAAEISSWEWNSEQRWGHAFDLVKGVVYKTTNGGKSWQSVWRGDNLARYIWIDPRDINVVYVSTGIFDREAANSDFASRNPGGIGILKSRDGGKTWTSKNNGLKNLYVGTLFMNPRNPDMLLAGAGNITYLDGAGVYRTVDGGEHWQQTFNGFSIESVEISTGDTNIVYAGGSNGFLQSKDGGQTWKMMATDWGPPGVRAGFPIDFQADPRDPQRLFANAYGGGVFITLDGGQSWKVASRGYTGVQTRDITVDVQISGRVVDAARSGLFVSSDGGSTWLGLNNPPAMVMEWNSIAIDPSASQHLVAGNSMIGLMQTRDGGTHWDVIKQRGEICGEPSSIVFAPSNPQVIYAGIAGVKTACDQTSEQGLTGFLSSRDGGKNWEELKDNQYGDMYVQQVAVDPQNDRRVYVNTSNYGVLKSSDGGASWQQIHPPWKGRIENAFIAINPIKPTEIFIGAYNSGLYRSQDSGLHWKRIEKGIHPESSVTSMVFQAGKTQTIFLSESKSGIYRSQDDGVSWELLNQGLLNRAVNRLALSADGLHLYAATEGGGVFRLDLNGIPPA